MATAQGYSIVLSLRSGHLSGHFLWKALAHVKVLLILKTKTIAKGNCFGSPARQRDSLVIFTQHDVLCCENVEKDCVFAGNVPNLTYQSAHLIEGHLFI